MDKGGNRINNWATSNNRVYMVRATPSHKFFASLGTSDIVKMLYENGGVWHEREYGNHLDEFINRKSIYLNDTLQHGDEKHG